MTDIEELLRRDARNWNAFRPDGPDLDVLLPAAFNAPPRTTHVVRWTAVAAAMVAAVVVAGLAVLLSGGGSRSPQPGGVRLGPLVTTRMGQLLVRHPAGWRYLPPGPPSLGNGSGFGWLTNAPAHKPCRFGVNELACQIPVRSLSPGGVFVSAGSVIQLAPPLSSAKNPFAFTPNRTVNGHPAELTEHAPGYTSGCPVGTTRSLALIIEMGKRPAAYRSGIWYVTACTAQPDRTTEAALARMFSTVRLAHGRIAADHAFRVKLVLPGLSFPANGQPIQAYVLAINHTGRPVVIHNACDGWVQAGLTGPHNSLVIANGDVACANDTIRTGTTRIDVSIPTTFAACQPGKGRGTPDMPHCAGPRDSRPPKLPPGNYRAEIETQSTSIRPVLSKPQPVTLTAVR